MEVILKSLTNQNIIKRSGVKNLIMPNAIGRRRIKMARDFEGTTLRSGFKVSFKDIVNEDVYRAKDYEDKMIKLFKAEKAGEKLSDDELRAIEYYDDADLCCTIYQAIGDAYKAQGLSDTAYAFDWGSPLREEANALDWWIEAILDGRDCHLPGMLESGVILYDDTITEGCIEIENLISLINLKSETANKNVIEGLKLALDNTFNDNIKRLYKEQGIELSEEKYIEEREKIKKHLTIERHCFTLNSFFGLLE